ncbi:hypothetical protein AGMMS49992_04810 [Clostridia bacterium]|nr:hypothetical protein AGMMS49992_04810 [Clostridia bacterium]
MVEISPLTKDNAHAFFDFFDNRAFTDHAEWSCCYCTYYHVCSEDEKAFGEQIEAAGGGVDGLRTTLRGAAAQFIEDGTLRGYLAFADGLPVGWVNANDKTSYKRFDHDDRLSAFIRGDNAERVKSITCFTIAPEFRGQGIASALLERVVSDARADGYPAVEGYPRAHDKREPFDFYGPNHMYEKSGFTKARETGNVAVMRKVL